MIKNALKSTFLALVFSFMLTSCWTYTTVVGNGAQGNKETKQWNHYLIFGLAPVNVSIPSQLANGAKDYTVVTKHSFVNGLVQGLTFGIYTPTTTTVIQ